MIHFLTKYFRIKFQINSKKCILAVFLVIALNGTIAWGGDRNIRFSSFLKFSGGVVSGFLIHEGAHALAAGITGTDMTWELGNYNQPIAYTEHSDSDTGGFIVNSAGLIAQLIGSEVILQVDKIDKNDAYFRGMMAWNIVNPILYALDYWLIGISNKKNHDSYQGDLQGLEHYSDKTVANVFTLAILGITAFQGYRFLKTQTWAPEWIKGNEFAINFTPTLSGGFQSDIKFSF